MTAIVLITPISNAKGRQCQEKREEFSKGEKLPAFGERRDRLRFAGEKRRKVQKKKYLTIDRSSVILNSCSLMGRGPSHIARKKILTAALQVFSAKGYREATVRDIARTAGVSVGALYPYFGNKEQLYTEAYLEQSREFNERILDLMDQDPDAAVRSFIETHVSWTASKRQIVSRHFKDYDLEFVKPFRTRFWTYQKEFLEALICKGAEQGLFRVSNCGEAAVFVLWALRGALFYDLSATAVLTRSGDAICELSLGFLTNGQTGASAAGRPVDPPSTPVDTAAGSCSGGDCLA